MRLEEIITNKLSCTVRGALAVGRSFRSVDRRLAALKERGLIETFKMLAPCIGATAAIHIHIPGMEPPDFDALAYFAERRTLIDVTTEVFIVATKRLRDRQGGCYGGKRIRVVDASHACRQAWVFHTLSPEQQAAWVPEARLPAEFDDAESLPDFMINDELGEVVGRYSAAKMRKRHQAWKDRPYKLY